MFPATTNRPAVRMLLSIGVLVVAGCGATAEEPAAGRTTSTTITSTSTTVTTSTTVVVTTEPRTEPAPAEPTDEDLQKLEEEVRADVIAGHQAYWDFLSSGDVMVVQPYVDVDLFEGYVANLLPDLEENGLFRGGFSFEVIVPSIEFTDDLSAALVRYCYVSDQDLVQVNEAGEETLSGQPANEPYGVIKRVERGEDGTWKTTNGTPRGLFGTELEETCAGLLGG